MRPARLGKGNYFGVAIERRAIGPFEFTETAYRPYESLASHRHEDPTVFIVLSGSVVEHSAAGDVEHPPLTAVFNPARFVHRTELRGATPRVLNIQFASSWLEANPDGGSEARSVVPRPFAAPAIARLYAELLQGRTIAAIESVVSEVIAPPRSSRGDRPLARRAASLVREHRRQPGYVTWVASELGVDRTSLAHAFRREYGLSLQEYAGRLRFAEACDLLDGGSSLISAAYEAGYADQSHMCRDFGRRIGVSPGQLRTLLRVRGSGFTSVQDS